MVLGEQTGAKLTWPAVKKLCTQSDIDRLACLAVAFINSGTVDQVISKRIKDAQASGKLDGVASPMATPGKGSTKKGVKRSAGEEGDRDDEEVQTPKRVKKDGKAVKKEEVKGEVGHSVASGREAGDDLDDYFK
ncbi:hypothetical protein LTR12_014009 [Friedmanniomyces endolithicus]|nr:hypothetical protein LTR12_014009 [Friedmanniomyces endolithicus]